jgi:hypothetical protein
MGKDRTTTVETGEVKTYQQSPQTMGSVDMISGGFPGSCFFALAEARKREGGSL